jgi:Cytochrome c7 and related cytochrome c
MSSILKVLAVSAFVVLLAVVINLTFLAGPEPIIQPIAYNHNVHVEGEGLECSDCHQRVEEVVRATLPDLETCMDCHDSDPLADDSVEEAKLISHIEDGTEIDWKNVYHVPSHVYFSHRRHVTVGDLECSSCHGDVGTLTTPAEVPFYPVTMEACMDCHRKSEEVTNDCIACHR